MGGHQQQMVVGDSNFSRPTLYFVPALLYLHGEVCTGTCAPFVMCGFISHMHEIVEMLLETTLHL